MLLSEVKEYLKLKKTQTLFQIARQFDVAIDVSRDMLQLLVRKGQVRVCTKTPLCGVKCGKCDIAEVEIYEWVGN